MVTWQSAPGALRGQLVTVERENLLRNVSQIKLVLPLVMEDNYFGYEKDNFLIPCQSVLHSGR